MSAPVPQPTLYESAKASSTSVALGKPESPRGMTEIAKFLRNFHRCNIRLTNGSCWTGIHAYELPDKSARVKVKRKSNYVYVDNERWTLARFCKQAGSKFTLHVETDGRWVNVLDSLAASIPNCGRRSLADALERCRQSSCVGETIYRVCPIGTDTSGDIRPREDLVYEDLDGFCRGMNAHIARGNISRPFVSCTKSLPLAEWFSHYGVLTVIQIEVPPEPLTIDLTNKSLREELTPPTHGLEHQRLHAERSEEVLFYGSIPLDSYERVEFTRTTLSVHRFSEDMFPQSCDNLTAVAELKGGSYPLKVRTADNTFFCLKRGMQEKNNPLGRHFATARHAANEVFSLACLHAWGCHAPTAALYTLRATSTAGPELVRMALLRQWLGDDFTTVSPDAIATERTAVVAALLSNYDICGPDGNNLLLSADNQLYHLDTGGCLLFSASGRDSATDHWSTTLKALRECKTPDDKRRVDFFKNAWKWTTAHLSEIVEALSVCSVLNWLVDHQLPALPTFQECAAELYARGAAPPPQPATCVLTGWRCYSGCADDYRGTSLPLSALPEPPDWHHHELPGGMYALLRYSSVSTTHMLEAKYFLALTSLLDNVQLYICEVLASDKAVDFCCCLVVSDLDGAVEAVRATAADSLPIFGPGCRTQDLQRDAFNAAHSDKFDKCEFGVTTDSITFGFYDPYWLDFAEAHALSRAPQ